MLLIFWLKRIYLGLIILQFKKLISSRNISTDYNDELGEQRNARIIRSRLDTTNIFLFPFAASKSY